MREEFEVLTDQELSERKKLMQQGSPTGRMATKILNERRVLPNKLAHGVAALFYNTGSFNTANGAHALHWNTTGFNNTANGVNALVTNTTGSV